MTHFVTHKAIQIASPVCVDAPRFSVRDNAGLFAALANPRPVKDIGAIPNIKDFCHQLRAPKNHTLFYPVKVAGSPIFLDIEYAHFAPTLETALRHAAQSKVIDLAQARIYLSISQKRLSLSETNNQPADAPHIDMSIRDGIARRQKSGLIYVASNCLSTIFCDNAVNFTDGEQSKILTRQPGYSFSTQLYKKTKNKPTAVFPDGHIVCFDHYNVHWAQKAQEPTDRTFLAIDISPDIIHTDDSYNIYNNAPLSQWVRRHMPSDKQGDYILA